MGNGLKWLPDMLMVNNQDMDDIQYCIMEPNKDTYGK